jgi:single-strand DNA-binding protein
MNKVILMGNVGADAELKFTQGGSAILKFNIATSERWKDKNGEQQERTDWHSCQMWGKRGEALAKHIVKGTKLLVTGSIRNSSYEDRDGNKRYRTDINVDDVEFCGGGKGGGGQRGERRAPNVADEDGFDEPPNDFDGGDSDSLPF